MKRTQNTNDASMDSTNIVLSIDASFVNLIHVFTFWSISQNCDFEAFLAVFDYLRVVYNEKYSETEWGISGKL